MVRLMVLEATSLLSSVVLLSSPQMLAQSSCHYQLFHVISVSICHVCQSQWRRGLRRRSTSTRLLRLWVQIPPGAWMSVCCECYVLSGRGTCDGLITRPEKSYRLWCVMCDLETTKILVNEEEAKAH